MMQERNKSVLKHMLDYCKRIDEAVEFFGDSYETFKTNNIYMDAVCLSVLQIGELTGVLTDEFKAEHSEMPWRQIKDLRNIVAHRYGSIDTEVLWEILRVANNGCAFCQKMIGLFGLLLVVPEEHAATLLSVQRQCN